MKKSLSLSLLAVPLLFAGICASLRARPQDKETPNREKRAKAVNVVRFLNTAEYTYREKKTQAEGRGGFATWNELLRQRRCQADARKLE